MEYIIPLVIFILAVAVLAQALKVIRQQQVGIVERLGKFTLAAEPGMHLIMPFVDLGLVPEAASSMIMPMLSGRRAAARYILLGEPFGADEAKAIGLASHVAPKGGMDAAFDAVVAALLAKPPEALRQTQRLLRKVEREAVLERMTLENGHFAERLASDEVKQAIMAFFAARSKAPAA